MIFVVMRCSPQKRTSSGNAIRRTSFYPACMILLSSSSVQKSISKSSPMRAGGDCSAVPVFFCSSFMFAHLLPLILNISSILLPIREVQRTQNDLFVRLRGRVYEIREQKSYIRNNRTNYEIIIGSPFSIASERVFDYNINHPLRADERQTDPEGGIDVKMNFKSNCSVSP